MNILILGASSTIAHACARRWAREGANLYLIARNPQKLETLAADLRVQGAAQVYCQTLDFDQLEQHASALEQVTQSIPVVDQVLLAFGTLPDQARCEHDHKAAEQAFHTNASAPLALLGRVAELMAAQGHGRIGVISSVAGDRGRQSNYIYGSAKAAVSCYCEGLRARLQPLGISVSDIRPGFVDTAMTADLELPTALLAQPDDVARSIVSAMQKRRDVVYTPWFWAWIMLIIRLIPRPIFKRLKF